MMERLLYAIKVSIQHIPVSFYVNTNQRPSYFKQWLQRFADT